MKTQVRLLLTLALTFLFAFANSEGTRCEASGSNANSALRKTETPGCQQNGKRPYKPLGHVALIDHAIELHETFMMNGRKYHLVFTRTEKQPKGTVSAVYVYPDGFKSGRQNGLIVDLPQVTEFIVHNVPGQELWGSVIICEEIYSHWKDDKGNYKDDYVPSYTHTYTDVRLPDEPAQKILDLIQDNSAYKSMGGRYGEPSGIKYNRVQTAELRKTKIEKRVGDKYTHEYSNERKF